MAKRMTPRRSANGTVLERATDQALVASRALVAVAARSLDDVASDITLRQFRALVVLSSRGDLNVSGMAELLGIHASTATRLCDRLLSKGLIERATSSDDRREVTVHLSTEGRGVVRNVTARRRREIRKILARMTETDQRRVVEAFATFAAAAGELPDDAWKLGWSE